MQNRPQKKFFSSLLLLFISLLVCLLLAEGVLRVLGIPRPVISGWRTTGPGWRTTGEEGPEINQLGFRGQKINYNDSDYVVLFLGDSQVQGAICSFSMMPEKRLEHYLNKTSGLKKNIKVFTVGTGGYGQDQEFLMLKEYFKKYRADLVVLWLTPQNDIRDNVFPSHWPANGAPKPTYWIKDSVLCGPSEKFGDVVYEEKFKLYALLNRALVKIGAAKKPARLRRDDMWDSLLPPPYQPLQNYNGRVKTEWQDALNKNLNVDGYVKDDNLENDKNRFNEYLTPVGDRTKYGLDLTRRLLDSMRITTEKHKGEFALFYINIPIENKDAFLQDGVYVLNGKKYRISQAQYEENLNFIIKGFRSFPVTITNKNWRVSYNNAHLNESTNDVAMRGLSDTLRSLIFLKAGTKQ